MTKRLFKKKFKIPVEKWALAKSIGGCLSDDIEGIQGASDPKNPSSKALRYIEGVLNHGVIYDRITSKEGQKIIKRNMKLTLLPYKPKSIPPMKIVKDNVTIKKIAKVFVNHGFQSLCEKDYFDKIRAIYG